MNLINLRVELGKLVDKDKAVILQRFFKIGEGEYGYGDVFLGITVPDSRKIAIKYKGLAFADIVKLLKSKIHEERLIALLILVHNFNIGDEEHKKKIFDFYIKNTKYINNWDLVDLSADKIVGGYLFNQKDRSILHKFANSKNLWERRIAMIATYYFIKNKQFEEALKITGILLSDRNDLIQKAVGWMLREIGKRDMDAELAFLSKHYKQMGRTALRYSIERFPQGLRLKYLHGEI